MESVLLGLSPTGMDRDFESVKAARENCEWLAERFGQPIESISFTQGDAIEMRRYFEPLSFDAVATEPYLGPPLAEAPHPRRIKSTINDLSSLYRGTLAEIRTVTRPKGRVVFVTPRFRDAGGNTHRVAVGSDIRLAGYSSINPTEGLERIERLKIPKDEIRAARSGVLLYGRPDQHVTREIHLLQA